MKWVLIVCLSLSVGACGGAITNSGKSVSAVNTVTSQPSPAVARTLQTVTIDSPDGLKLAGTLYPAANPHSKALLLLHQWQSDRHSYDDLAQRLQTNGFAVLSIDGRGFGESTKTADGKTIAAGRTDADVKSMLDDVGASFEFLRQQPNVDNWRVGIVGASYGSSLAIIYAADNSDVGAVALLSPGLNYFGNMQTDPAIKKYGNRPLLFVAAEDDKESADAVRKLDPTGRDAFKYPQKIFGTGGHGTALLQVGAAEELESFFSRTFDFAGKQNVRP